MMASLFWALSAIVLVALAVVFISATVLNGLEYRTVRRGLIIPIDVTELLDVAAGMPWNPKFRGQPWPDPAAEPPVLTVEAAWLYAGAARRRADSRRHAGEITVVVFGLPLALVANSIAASWPMYPSTASAVLGAVSLVGVGVGARLKVATANHWDAISDSYAATAHRISIADATPAPVMLETRQIKRRTLPDRVRAAWKAFFS